MFDVHDAASVTSKLLQVADYSLYGCVQSMEKVRLLHSKRDTLLLSFNDAKVQSTVCITSTLLPLLFSPSQLSAIEFDPETNRLKTMSLHCFEDEDLRVSLLYILIAGNSGGKLGAKCKFYPRNCVRLGPSLWRDSNL